MKAVVLTRACLPSELSVTEVPAPEVRPGWLLVRVRAFGLNHAESIMRSVEADAPYIHLPRIPGIECAGEVEDPSNTPFHRGQKVVALMGGMGRSFDGSYAEYALIPSRNVFYVDTDLDWIHLAAIPETWFTVYSALFGSLQLQKGDSILIRGATSAAGLAAIALAKSTGCTVFASTRSEAKTALLAATGADHVVIDDGSLPGQVRGISPHGLNKVLELVGPATLLESMGLLCRRGIACTVGVLGKQYTIDHFDPIKDIPAETYLSSFYSNFPTQQVVDELFAHIASCNLKPCISRVFTLEEIADAHALLDSGTANGKIVVTTGPRFPVPMIR